MKIRKTRTEDRGVYRYPISVPDGNGGYRQDNIIIRPGENEITEAWISTLHSLDDSEVYYNCKNGHPPMSAEEKAARKEWKEEHPGEKYPTGWNLSLDYYADSDDDAIDKQKFLEDTSVSFGDDVSPQVEHLHEIIETMTHRQQEVYKLLFIEANLILTHDADDGLLLSYITAAVSYAESYQHVARGFYNENAMPPTTEQAIIMLSGHFYESRDGSTAGFYADSVQAGQQVWNTVNMLLRLDRNWGV